MGENENVQQMAERLSDELARVVGWDAVGTINQGWSCADATHRIGKGKTDKERKKHPADIVYKARDPYSDSTTYVLTDLKSYAEATMKWDKIRAAIVNLGESVNCANISPQFRKLFIRSDRPHVVGLLFLYCHDSPAPRDFADDLGRLDPTSAYSLRADESKLIVITPRRVQKLMTVANELQKSRSGAKWKIDDFSWWNPTSVLMPLVCNPNCLTPSHLVDPWLIGTVAKVSLTTVFVLDDQQCTAEGFFYLIDMLFRQQIVKPGNSKAKIEVKAATVDAANAFDAAKQNFNAAHLNALGTVLKQITFKSMVNTVPFFDQTEIGLEPRYDE